MIRSACLHKVIIAAVLTIASFHPGSAQSNCASACTNTFYGPQKFERTKSEKNQYVAEFQLPSDATGPYNLHIQNGDPSGSNRVSSATISIVSGAQVLFQSDLNQNIATIDRCIALGSTNEVKIVLASVPGSYLSISICGTIAKPTDNTPPSISPTLNPAPNKYNWNNSDVNVSFFCTDNMSGVAECPLPVTVTQESSENIITGIARDNAGNEATASVTVKIDKTPPALDIIAPLNGSYLNKTQVIVQGAVSDLLSGIDSLWCNGIPISRNGNTFTAALTLDPGSRQIVMAAVDSAGNRASDTVNVIIDTAPPVVKIISPENGAITNNPEIHLVWMVDNAQLTLDTMLSGDGEHAIIRKAIDEAGNAGSDTIRLTLDTQAPLIKIAAPANGLHTSQTSIQVQWTVDGIEQTTELIENLASGENRIIRTAADLAGNIGADTVIVFRESIGKVVEIEAPANGSTISTSQVSCVFQVNSSDITGIRALIDGQDEIGAFSKTGDVYSASFPLPDGHHVLAVYVSSSTGRTDTARAAFNVLTLPAETQITIHGLVFNGKSAQPISGVMVQVVETGSSATTDEQGKFNLPSGGFGQYKIKVTHPKFTDAMRFVSADSGINVTLDPIQIIPLDTQKIRIPANVDTTIRFSNTGIRIHMPAGSIAEAKDLSATLFTHIDQLPNAQPGNEVFLFCIDLKPNNLAFADSITVSVPNLSELSPKAPVPITYFNENTALWDSVGLGYVSDDGSLIYFKTNHFSTYHGNWHTAEDAKEDTAVKSTTQKKDCPYTPVKSGVANKNGNLTEDFTIPGGPAQSNINARLVYWGSAAQARTEFGLRNDYIPTVPTYKEFQIFIPGTSKHWAFYGPTVPYAFNYIWKADTLKTGLYPYVIRMSDIFMPGRYRYRPELAENLWVTYFSPTEKTSYYYGFTTLINRISSPYGAGWHISGVNRLFQREMNVSAAMPIRQGMIGLGGARGTISGKHVVIVGGKSEGDIYWYDERFGVYHPSYGSADTLLKQPDGWMRRMSNGTEERYSIQGLLLSVTDKTGNRVQYSYDPFGERVLQITDVRTGNTTKFLYDDRDKLSRIIDQFGRTTIICIDQNNDLTRIETPDGNVARLFTYDDHKLVKQSMPGGTRSEYCYNDLGSIIKTRSPGGREISFFRSADSNTVNGLPELIDSSLSYFQFSSKSFCTTSDCVNAGYSVLDLSNQPINSFRRDSDRYGTVDQDGHTTEYSFDGMGRMISQTNAAGEITRYSYDTIGCGCAATATTTYSNGLVIARVSDSRGNLLSDSNSSTGATTRYTYLTRNGTDLVSSITNALGQATRFDYDARGNLVTLISPGNDSTHIYYDSLSRPIAISDPLKKVVRTNYDSIGRIIARVNPKGDSTLYAYDEFGNLSSIRDPMGKKSRYDYDIMGRLTSETNPAGNVTRYAYGSDGLLDSLIDPLLHVTNFQYDSAGNLVESRNHLGFARHYQYGHNGELLRYTNARGMAINYQYDELQRLVRKATDDSTVLARFGYDNAGNMVYASTPEYAINRIFDQASRLTQEKPSSLQGQSMILDNDTIAANDFSYDYTNLVVDGGTAIIDGKHHFLSLRIINGASVKHLPTDTISVHRMEIFARDSILIDATSRIDVTGLGYLGGGRYDQNATVGRTFPNSFTGGSQPGAGGSHGGKGGDYRFKGGTVLEETSLGSMPFGNLLPVAL
jgi:YD repeat-containing protein